MRGFVGRIRRCWLQVIDNEQFGDSGVICAASATVEDCGNGSVKGDTRTHTLACANTCMSMARRCVHALIVVHVHTRAHAEKTPTRPNT